MPSARLGNGISLPVPHGAAAVPAADRFSPENDDGHYVLSAQKLITIAFNGQPDIKSSYHRYRSEEARYDFFYTSRDSLTPRLRLSNNVAEWRTGDDDNVTRTRDHTVEFGIEKLFFDTTHLDASMGFYADSIDEAHGNQPFVSANLRYPLWASREKLERTSEEIFWQNQVDDAQLGYIQTVRWRLQHTLLLFQEVVDLRRRIEHDDRWLRDLESLAARLDAREDQGAADDRRRVEAEIAKVGAGRRNSTGRFDVVIERLKAACGLPFHAVVELRNEPFNPFQDMTHDELFRLSIETDPEIATLRNARRNAEVQLDLARRGRWDLAVLLSGSSDLEGGGDRDGESDWSVGVGFEVSAVDARVTNSLIRQAQSNIARFDQAIASRENAVYVDTFEPLTRIETLGQSRDELAANLQRYQADYDQGLIEYFGGNLNIDDLLKRREDLREQEEEISHLTRMVAINVAELCSATGKFFELLEAYNGT
jgi:outer membrane protein TolC